MRAELHPSLLARFALPIIAAALLSAPGLAHAEASAPRLAIATDDGSSSIRFQLAAQVLWWFEYTDQGSGAAAVYDNAIRFRRLRTVIGGSLVSENFTYKLHLNLVPGAIELIDLWFDYRFHAHFAVRLGQGKVPFTRYRFGSFRTRPVVDWSYPSKYFGSERQIGLTMHNNMGRPPRVEYQVGIYTGVNARDGNGVGMPLVFGESRPNPSDLIDPAAPDSFHPELAAHIAYNHDDINVRDPQDWEGGPPRFSAGFSAAWDLQPTAGQDFTLRLAPEAVFKVHGFTLWGVFYLAFWDEVAGDGGLGLGMLGGMAQASYAFLEHFDIGLRYTNVSILSALRQDARRHADARIAAEEDEAARAELESALLDVGQLEAEHELTLGFNVYLLARTLRLSLDGAMLLHQRIDGNRYDMRIRIQTQFAF